MLRTMCEPLPPHIHHCSEGLSARTRFATPPPPICSARASTSTLSAHRSAMSPSTQQTYMPEVDLQRKTEVLAQSKALNITATGKVRWKDDPCLLSCVQFKSLCCVRRAPILLHIGAEPSTQHNLWRNISDFDRHRGGSCLPTPATPPCIRVRTRRFEKLR
jgi:hypothetical protein